MRPQAALATGRKIYTIWLDLPLRIKGLVVVSIPLLALVAATANFYLFGQADQQSDARVAQTARAITSTQRCLRQLLLGEYAVHEYLYDGRPPVQDLDTATKALGTELEKLNTLVDEPSERAV